MNVNGLKTNKHDLMPALFIGHGSPLNALESNEFTDNWREIATKLPIPNSIVCISAHWETNGSFVTASTQPATIHDFGGFPDQLYRVKYDAPGNESMAREIRNLFLPEIVGLDYKRGLDHGTWSILCHMYPHANIPVLQLSIDYNKTIKEHYLFAKRLHELRSSGVLIVGSGNLVHNLREVSWNVSNDTDFGYIWAKKADAVLKNAILEKNYDKLFEYEKMGKSIQKAIPTPDHFIPAIYILSVQQENESIKFFNEKAIMGSLTMTSFIVF